MTKKTSIKSPKKIVVNSKLLEAVGYLASAPKDRTYSAEFFREKGLTQAVNALIEMGMVVDSKEGQTPYSISRRGRNYASFILEVACTLSNRGRTVVNYDRQERMGRTIEPRVEAFEASLVKIEYRR